MSSIPTSSPSLPSGWTGGVCELTHWGVIRAVGTDAVSFLHNQLTHDFALLRPDQARLCGYCNPKGRLLASFIGIRRSDDEVLLICSRDVLAATLKRLSMFVLRAKVKLSDASDQWRLEGWVGDALHTLAKPDTEADLQRPWQKRSVADADLITLYPALGQARALRLIDLTGTSHIPITPPFMALDDWKALEVLSGVVLIQAETTEAFVPQMINYESVDGVSFKKGCYPGQEVVARSQFRGAIKRRGQLFWSPQALAPGAELFTANDLSQPAGTVAQSAPWQGQHVVFASIQMNALEASSSSLQDARGHPLTHLPLPYPLRDDL
jgi:folate-binding protein YgfZ